MCFLGIFDFYRCGQVFPNPIPIVCDLLSETLSGLDPSLPVSIQSYLQAVESPLPALIELKKVKQSKYHRKREEGKIQ